MHQSNQQTSTSILLQLSHLLMVTCDLTDRLLQYN